MKTFISGTNTTSHMFMPFTRVSFVNDCRQKPMLRQSSRQPHFLQDEF